MGSVKDLFIIIRPAEKKPGIGRFNFSDRYSVFDWGEMPDHIKNKGKALCLIGACFFEKLNALGISNHYLGLFDKNGAVVPLNELKEPSESMAVNLYRVIKPAEDSGNYDYSAFRKINSNYLVPLEIIYRNSLPEGSSFLRRLKSGEIKPEDYGLSFIPEPGFRPDTPILDVSTKLEYVDRYLSWSEASNISGLLYSEIEEIREKTLAINNIITENTGKSGLINEDGKLEFAVNENDELTVIDVFGTPDECRFTLNGIHVSKELARIFYRETEWFSSIESIKKTEKTLWREKANIAPPALTAVLSELLSEMYQAACNEITGREWFKVDSLSRIMDKILNELPAARMH